METDITSTKGGFSYNLLSAVTPLLLPLFLPLILAVLHITASKWKLHQSRTKQSLKNTISPAPHVHHLTPYIGHVLSLQRQSAVYVNSLIHKLPFQHFTINILSRKIHVLSPSLERLLSRHVDDTGLAQIISVIGPSIFDLSAKTVAFISENNPRPQHHAEFLNGKQAQELKVQSRRYVYRLSQAGPPPREGRDVDVGRWIFRNTVKATAFAVCGPENPWIEDAEFGEKFMRFAECFDNLGRPLNWLTAPKAYHLRRFLVRRLKAHHEAHPDSMRASAQHRINAVAMHDPEWATNPDYLGVEMISAIGFLVTPSTLTVWTLRHLLANPEVMRRVVAEVRNLPEDADGEGGVDLSDVKVAAPWFTASWYESLRLHMTGVPRLARRDFNVEPSSSDRPGESFRKGDIILLPMYTHNRDASLFGPEADDFRPERLLDPQGLQLNGPRVRKIKLFGVAGNLCPGRYLGQEIALATLAETLRRYDLVSVDGGRFPEPRVANGFAVGFQRLTGDVRVRLTRREDVES